MDSANLYALPVLFTLLLNAFLSKRQLKRSASGMPAAGIPGPVSPAVYADEHDTKNAREALIRRIARAKGCKIRIAATGLGKTGRMALSQNGTLYITRKEPDAILLLADPDRYGRFQRLHAVISESGEVQDLAIKDGYLYVYSETALKRAEMRPDGSLKEPEALKEVLTEPGHDQRINAGTMTTFGFALHPATKNIWDIESNFISREGIAYISDEENGILYSMTKI